MAIELAIFGAIYSLSNPILRKVIAGNESKELSKQGNLVNWLGKSILVLIGLVTIVYVSIVDVEIVFIYWFVFLFMMATTVLQLAIDWLYMKGTKQYLASLITLIVGSIIYYLIFLS